MSGRLLALAIIMTACLVGTGSSARSVSVVALLDRYASGQFDEVVRELADVTDFEDLLGQLRRDGPAWLASGDPGLDERHRRDLVAATFALEAARVDSWNEWKWLVAQPPMAPAQIPGEKAPKGDAYIPLNRLVWKPPPLLIEWACGLLRRYDEPLPIERWWQLAAVAVAQRSEDAGFLVGDTAIGRGVGAGEIINTQDEIKHLDHVQKRFPSEPRFMLAQGIARDRSWLDDAIVAYTAVVADPDVGGEAAMRLGAAFLRNNRLSDALHFLEQAESLTRDRYVIYLAHYFKGQLHERQKRADLAQAEYRRAVAAWPSGQAATVSLASSLFITDRRAEAQELAASMLDAPEPLFDPWREYVHADNRFWPVLIGKLRDAVRK